MKKLIIKISYFALFFTIFFALINLIYYIIISQSDPDFRKRIETLQFVNPDYELLVLGASTSLDGIDAKMISSNGIKSYNMAIGGSSVRTNYIQLKEYITKFTTKPQYVLLGLNSNMVQSFDDNIIQPIVEITMEDHKYLIEDVPILKLKWLGFEFLKRVMFKSHRDAKLEQGQIKFKGTRADNTSFSELYLDTTEFQSSYWISEIAKLCNQNNIELIVMEMPGYRNTQNLSDIGPYILNFDNGASAKLYNYASREFCEIFDSNNDWIGNSHLNELGASKFTKELIKLIKGKAAIQ